MTRDDLSTLCALAIDHEAIGLMEPGRDQEPYFCTPMEARYVGRLGADGVHFVLLPGDERVFCVDPSMGEVGTYVLPVAANLRQFLSCVLYCRDASPVAQIYWLSEERFRTLLEEDRETTWPGCEEFFARKDQALDAIARTFDLTPVNPYGPVKELQKDFDPGCVRFSDEYYDVLGLER